MTTKYILDRVLGFIQDLTAFYSELSEELPENFLRVVVDNTRGSSELKKMPAKCLTLQALRRRTNKIIMQSLPKTRQALQTENLPAF